MVNVHRVVSHSAAFAAFAENQQSHVCDQIDKRRVRRRVEDHHKNFWGKINGDETTVTGEYRLRSFMKIVHNCFVWCLHRFQRRFISVITQSLAPFLVGNDWETVGPAVMKEFSWKKIKMQTIGTAPRRFGKSVVVGVAQAAVAMVVPSCNQATFSTGKRASGGLRDSVLKTFIESGYQDYIATRGTGAETILTRPIFGDPNNFSKSSFYPSNKNIGFSRSLYCVCLGYKQGMDGMGWMEYGSMAVFGRPTIARVWVWSCVVEFNVI